MKKIKHNLKITLILVSMFIITQIIGLFVIAVYNSPANILPYGMEPPEDLNQETSIVSILFAFLIAISLFFLLTKIKAEKFLRLWFFVVTIIAMALTINAILSYSIYVFYASFIALVVAIPLAYLKVFQRNIIVHNLTELLIYPGIAAVFVPILNVLGIIILLLVISLYDIWAVWHSEFMQKMAKFQINNLRFFAGFFIPYAGKKQREKIKQLKQKYAGKSEKTLEKQFKKAKIKISLAILGGGDVIFPIITAGVFFKTYGLFSALIIILSSILALSYLFFAARKGKFYPAMPFITIGIYLGMIVSWLVF